MKKVLINETGNTYGRLTVIRQWGVNKSKEALWYCRCICGKYITPTGGHLRSGRSKSCGCGRRKGRGVSYLNQKLRRYREDAKKRNLKWTLSEKDFFNLIFQPCYYCGNPPTNPKVNINALNTNGTKRYPTGIVSHNGIDRMDNEKGYTLQNSISCCKDCNWAKGTKTISQFRDWVRRVYLTWGR